MVTVTYSVLGTLSNSPPMVVSTQTHLRPRLGTSGHGLIQAELVLDVCSGR